MGTTTRKLARRKRKRILSPIESARPYRVTYITHLAATTLGGLAKARLWLRRESRALGGHTPLSLLDTEIGGRQVEETLVQLNQGIFA